jgi:hypothetical protein
MKKEKKEDIFKRIRKKLILSVYFDIEKKSTRNRR